MPLPPRQPGPSGDGSPSKRLKRPDGPGGPGGGGGAAPKKRRRRPSPSGPLPIAAPKASGPPWRTAAGVVLVLAGMVGAGVALLLNQATEEEAVASHPDQVARPSIQPRFESMAPKRPGLVVAPPDEVYLPKALDVAGSDLEGPVTALLERGVVTVFADGSFRAKEPLPRAEFLLWAYNAVMAQSVKGDDPFIPVKVAIPSATATGQEFSDVPLEHWAAPVAASMKASGILGPALGTALLPDGPLSREQLVAWAARLCVTKVDQAPLQAPADPAKLAAGLRRLNFTEPEKVGEGFQAELAFMLADDKRRRWVAGAFPGPVNPGPFMPQSPVTRGEAVGFLGEAYAALGLGMQ